MRKYFERDGVELWLGDCLDLPKKVDGYDLLLTDPPYGVAYKSGHTEAWGEIQGDRPEDRDGIYKRLDVAMKALKRDRHVYLFGKWELIRFPLCSGTELVWDKGVHGGGDLTLPWGPEHEVIQFAVYESSKACRDKGYGKLAARLRKGSVLRHMRPNNGGRALNHPNDKPVPLLRELIESSSTLGEVVLDPFCGSGSTLVAALLEGRGAVGVEIEERWCEVAAKRLERLVVGAEG